MKKKLLLIAAAFCAGLAFAVPGVTPYIEDISGEYVYYRDYSFNRESYIGFLTYSNSTYSARYFAPAQDDLAPKSIELLFTVDPDKEYIDMTGERFVTQPAPEDTEIINYIHDLIYEFSSRRKKAGEISRAVIDDPELNSSVVYENSSVFMNSGFRKKEEFPQFGGDVFIYYDFYIPIFNVKKIISNSQEVLFEAVCNGRIRSTEDTSFSNFQIQKNEDKNETFNHKNKKPKSVTYETENTKITLDDNWQRGAESAENLFFYDGEAMVYIREFDEDITEDMYIRNLFCQVEGTFYPFSEISILDEDENTTVRLKCYSSDSSFERFVLLKSKNGKKIMLNMVVNEKCYNEKRKYYRNILKSWK
ncbi:MAG: hypothetical protein KBT21_07895 [Treponema sp.]|nr:hypothetical protein [Candidatus Treponema merdequi]